jgi:hypothetical protein
MGSRHITEMLDGVHVLNATELALKAWQPHLSPTPAWTSPSPLSKVTRRLFNSGSPLFTLLLWFSTHSRTRAHGFLKPLSESFVNSLVLQFASISLSHAKPVMPALSLAHTPMNSWSSVIQIVLP